MMASNAIMPYAFIKPLEGEFSMSLSIRMRFPSCLFQYSGGYATADRDHIDDQRQSPLFTFYGSLKIRPQENSLDGMGAEWAQPKIL